MKDEFRIMVNKDDYTNETACGFAMSAEKRIT
jgi:hypothetical protein